MDGPPGTDTLDQLATRYAAEPDQARRGDLFGMMHPHLLPIAAHAARLFDIPGSDPDDREADIMLAWLHAFEKFDPARSPATAYARLIAKSLMHDLFRKATTAKRTPPTPRDEPGLAPCSEPDPSDIAADREEWALALNLLRELLTPWEFDFALAVEEGFTSQELSEIYDMSVPTIKRRRAVVKEKLLRGDTQSAGFTNLLADADPCENDPPETPDQAAA